MIKSNILIGDDLSLYKYKLMNIFLDFLYKDQLIVATHKYRFLKRLPQNNLINLIKSSNLEIYTKINKKTINNEIRNFILYKCDDENNYLYEGYITSIDMDNNLSLESTSFRNFGGKTWKIHIDKIKEVWRYEWDLSMSNSNDKKWLLDRLNDIKYDTNF